MENTKIYHIIFADVYPLYIQKVVRKGRTKEEVDNIITWMTGYGELELKTIIENKYDFEYFFNHAPKLNENLHKIKGKKCGYDLDKISVYDLDPGACRSRLTKIILPTKLQISGKIVA